jgi:hypothetical protein
MIGDDDDGMPEQEEATEETTNFVDTVRESSLSHSLSPSLTLSLSLSNIH